MNALAPQLEDQTQLLDRLAHARAMTEDLFRRVRSDALYDRPIGERHRIVFYIGHLEAFDWNLIAGQALGLGPADTEFDRLFAFGIDPLGGGLPQDQPSDWPPLAQVESYAHHVQRVLNDLLNGRSRAAANDWRFPPDIILNVAIEHRLMHAETLTYMVHQLSLQRKMVPHDYLSVSPSRPIPPAEARMIDIPAGTATLGVSRTAESFAWDNEFEEHSVQVPAFAIGSHKVTNGEFLRFVREGGYNDRQFWSDADWAWIKEQNIVAPHLWFMRQDQGRPDQWFCRAMFEEIPLPLDWPVYVSHAEASAYARFAGGDLPTEAQFHRAAYGTPDGVERAYPWGDAPPDATRGNFDFHHWDPVAVGSRPAGRSAFGLDDTLGNGWEWTSSPFTPHPGFEPSPYYSGYSADFFDGKHFVAKGASPRTAACMLRRSFRNWFQPHYPYVYASFRCVQH
jgi:ergothioneine biosynthesis protein EgtB